MSLSAWTLDFSVATVHRMKEKHFLFFFPMEHHLSVQIDERLKTRRGCAGVTEGHRQQTVK